MLVELVQLRLQLLRAGVWRVRVPSFGLEGEDGRVELCRVLRGQGGAIGAPLQADLAPEDVQRAHAFDGAETAQ